MTLAPFSVQLSVKPLLSSSLVKKITNTPSVPSGKSTVISPALSKCSTVTQLEMSPDLRELEMGLHWEQESLVYSCF